MTYYDINNRVAYTTQEEIIIVFIVIYSKATTMLNLFSLQELCLGSVAECSQLVHISEISDPVLNDLLLMVSCKMHIPVTNKKYKYIF